MILGGEEVAANRSYRLSTPLDDPEAREEPDLEREGVGTRSIGTGFAWRCLMETPPAAIRDLRVLCVGCEDEIGGRFVDIASSGCGGVNVG